ncbi:competence protein ComGD [Salibacterium salarium]|uniref:competence type IV pilus minor pilin ComGD n=1 Tax=Salibacterium salarium TaxID=284579 RepID=UPI00278B894F|nr:competence type IV pilus minor pilin ComGD [Salibacterium salarium]MDQ0299613.1 competence protein ComGD [Salibacterium salarium]
MKYMNKESGHTLIEMVIILLIITVTISIPILSFQSLQEKKSIDYFINVLEEDLRYAQQLAYANEELIYFRAVKNQYYIKTSIRPNDSLKQRTIPEGVSIQKATLAFNEIMFKNNGNAIKAGTVYISTPIADYKLVVLVGKGRVYIEKF